MPEFRPLLQFQQKLPILAHCKVAIELKVPDNCPRCKECVNRDEVSHLKIGKRFSRSAFFFCANGGNHAIGASFFKDFAVIGKVDDVVGQPVQQPKHTVSVERIIVVKE